MHQFHITWDSYQKNICNGFSHLQQHEEFVDMTLAAEGHLVKVHKTLLALASPYLKEVIQSAPCQHPVVFLTNVNHEILGFLLEYVYTGEVALPTSKVNKFLETAKALHISGLHNIKLPGTTVQRSTEACDTELLEENGCSSLKDAQEIKANFTKSVNKTSTVDITTTNSAINHSFAVNAEATNLSSNQGICLTSQTATGFEHLIGNTYPEQLRSENCVVNAHLNTGATLSHQKAEFILASVPNSQSQTQIVSPDSFEQLVSSTAISNLQHNTSISKLNQSHTENIANNEVIADQDNEMEQDQSFVTNINNEYDTYTENDNSMAVEYRDNPQYELDKLLKATSKTNINTDTSENYSINLEMPAGDNGPPKITIQAGLIENIPPMTSDTDKKNTVLDGEPKNHPGKSIPKITINAGVQQDIPYISISNSNIPFEPNQCGEAVNNSQASIPLYMESTKGSLQMILNRFIYSLHNLSNRAKKMRWRCIDYRHNRCPAYVDTVGEVIVGRMFAHKHLFHDEKILKMGQRKQVYESLREVSVSQQQLDEPKTEAAASRRRRRLELL